MLRQRRFNLSRLNAKSANLYLSIGPAQMLDVAIRQVSAQIAGAIESIIFATCKWISNEAFTRQGCITQISSGQMRTAKIDFSGFADAAELLLRDSAPATERRGCLCPVAAPAFRRTAVAFIARRLERRSVRLLAAFPVEP